MVNPVVVFLYVAAGPITALLGIHQIRTACRQQDNQVGAALVAIGLLVLVRCLADPAVWQG